MLKDIIIPAGGLGTRMKEVTGGKISKLMLPFGNKPMIYYAVKEAVDSGIEKIHIVVNEGKADIIDYLKTTDFAGKINIVFQKEPLGVGDALYYAKDDLTGDFFGVIFPDAFVASEEPALKQMIPTFEKVGGNVLGLIKIPKENLDSVGSLCDIKTHKCEEGLEVNEIPPKTRVGGSRDNYKMIICRPIFSKNFFKHVDMLRDKNLKEIDDPDVIRSMMNEERFFAHIINGDFLDAGTPSGYKKTKERFENGS